MVFVKRQAKEYGTYRLAEGISGRRLLIVEDVVTSGGQMLDFARELRKDGAMVEHAVCVIDHEAGGRESLAAAGLWLRALFTKSDLDRARE